MLDESSRDYTYYRDKGWFESSYYYPARLNVLKRSAGALIDYVSLRNARKESALRKVSYQDTGA